MMVDGGMIFGKEAKKAIQSYPLLLLLFLKVVIYIATVGSRSSASRLAVAPPFFLERLAFVVVSSFWQV